MRKRQSSIPTPPRSLKKSPSIVSHVLEKQRQLEEDILILGQITDLAKTISTPHQVTFTIVFSTMNFSFFN